MKSQTLSKIVSIIEELPERRARSLLEYIQFLRWTDDTFSEREIALIREARKAAHKGKGTPWRSVRNDV